MYRVQSRVFRTVDWSAHPRSTTQRQWQGEKQVGVKVSAGQNHLGFKLIMMIRSARTSGNPAQHAAVSTHNDVLLPTLDTSSMHEEILLDRFLGFFVLGARKSSWVLKLPDLRNSSSASTLRSGLRAVTLAYAAHQTQDVRVKVAAYKNYATSLSGQRMALSRLQVSNSQAAVYVLLATVILSYFELISCTTSEAWSEHTKAAERLITMLDPGLLKHDLMLGVFHSVRSHAVRFLHEFHHYR